MIRNILIASLIAIFILGCGGGGAGSSTNINSDKAVNSLGYYDDLTLFYNSVITGFWMKKDKKYGFEYLYYFKNDIEADIDVFAIDYFYDKNNYGVDITGNQLSTYKYYTYSEDIEIEDPEAEKETEEKYDYNKSIVEHFDFKSVNKENDCLLVSNYEDEGGEMSSSIDYDFCANSLNYTEHTFATHTLAGLWIQYEYDENDVVKGNNELGIEFLYQFDYNGKMSMNISLIDTWIPLGKYATDENEEILSFEEGSPTAIKQFEFVEHRDPIPLSYLDENEETQTKDMPCVKVGKYNIDENDNSKTFDKYYQLCKKN